MTEELDQSTQGLVASTLAKVDSLDRELHDLRERLRALVPADRRGLPFVAPDSVDLENLERLYIEHTLRRLDGNKTRAAEALRIDASTLHRKMVRWTGEQPYSGSR